MVSDATQTSASPFSNEPIRPSQEPSDCLIPYLLLLAKIISYFLKSSILGKQQNNDGNVVRMKFIVLEKIMENEFARRKHELVAKKFKQIDTESFVAIVAFTTTFIRIFFTTPFYHYKRCRLKLSVIMTPNIFQGNIGRGNLRQNITQFCRLRKNMKKCALAILFSILHVICFTAFFRYETLGQVSLLMNKLTTNVTTLRTFFCLDVSKVFRVCSAVV